ncbi:PREDICTED: F-box/FBD/LRR-repeat protein At2g26030-like [Camelina sativa]|uniref:F-box/FBD/LRR-repeat protein At2g26030-like n=1 Tax=Camelina sativa TaxID=90675 RepID=A0ABM1RSE5_CAMSA|nr:PREDICTED: F-box/FBD/LRR-repeat protein At2g26030-like [Camelina sativa]
MSSDRISNLPDSLLTHILSFLATNDSVRASVLSKRFELLWLSVPGSNCFPMTTLPMANPLRELSATSTLTWTSTTTTAHEFKSSSRDYLTDKIYNSDTLVSLKLANVGLSDLNPAVGVSLPCLKILNLADVSYDDEDPLFMEKLISGCPVLEEFALALPYDHHERQKSVVTYF